MTKSTTPAGPQFTDEQSDLIVALPTFITRTTLQSILQANGVKSLRSLVPIQLPPK
jgi:hypothetical protein